MVTPSARERLVHVALRAFPATTRARLGAEMQSTVLDAQPTSGPRFVAELAQLVRFGLNNRAGQVAGAGLGRLLADGIARGATWIMVLDLSTLLVWRLTGTWSNPLTAAWSIALLAAVLAVALIGYDRVAGVAGLVFAGLRAPQLAAVTDRGQWLPPLVLLAGCFVVMVLFPRQRPADLRRLGWLLVPAWLVSTYVLSGRANGVVFLELLVVVLLVLLAALLTLPTDPRPAITALIPIMYASLSFERGDPLIPMAVILALPLVVVGLASLRVRRVRARS